jgi:hypothetical protein
METTTETEESSSALRNAHTRLDRVESDVRLVRQFITNYKSAFSKVKSFYAWGWDTEIKMHPISAQTAKEIAVLFGPEGWERIHDSGTCGSINWLKTIDGIKLVIEGAENIKPKLIAEVKLA